ncbi:hypothetical protein A3C87_02665 [Candidatus Kaiserbacteria bacterium RIFCSPHIGHO2_02_FULL_49_34]|uniref:Metallo-beta-lactamase domain-containing protein n=1 Tax=Candidatus Kaiserbacteria bacterium RIFCSPHIGHO2_02_FULL_49_34 TaxID=1798491 RepID=A0A1F6DJC6_9BACT|nr:MAG: hypothetical protein A3C87_02665 [Candidatus Kaiserbacteria bacterium RIFCSPHIGHO2_02_FULL_49_34]
MTKNITRFLYMRGAILIASVLCVVLFVSYTHTTRETTTCDVTRLCVAFLDVGQGDAIYVRSPSGKSLLVDGGKDGSVLRELPKVTPPRERAFMYVVATHPDMDHVGGLAAVVQNYDVDTFVTIESEKETQATKQLGVAVIDKNVNRVVAYSGDVYDLGGGVIVQVLFPFKDMDAEDANEESIVMMVTYGTSSFLLTGDAPMFAEHEMVRAYAQGIQADVLKAGHHGSKTSSSAYFLAAVQPSIAVISAGKDNSYGHPHQNVIESIAAAGAQILNTADNGTIIMESDAQKITVRRAR